MKLPRTSSAKTYKRLLAAAADIFAEKGYRDATIAEISERAAANIAAVNYHFGDKETLYREAWRHSFLESIKAHPPDGGVPHDAPPEERLRGQVAALLRRIADENNRGFRIVQKELATPTGLLKEVMREVIRPLQDRVRVLVRELLGPHVSDLRARFCEISIISQCLNPVVVGKGRGSGDDLPEIEDMDAYTDHVMQFSLGGMRALRAYGERNEESPNSPLKNSISDRLSKNDEMQGA